MRETYKYQLESDMNYKELKYILKEDLVAWSDWKKMAPNMISFLKLFLKYTEFRRLVDYRLKSCSCVWGG